VLGVVIIQFTGLVGIPDPCEERDAMEKEEFKNILNDYVKEISDPKN
jgi:hypothetical protein